MEMNRSINRECRMNKQKVNNYVKGVVMGGGGGKNYEGVCIGKWGSRGEVIWQVIWGGVR